MRIFHRFARSVALVSAFLCAMLFSGWWIQFCSRARAGRLCTDTAPRGFSSARKVNIWRRAAKLLYEVVAKRPDDAPPGAAVLTGSRRSTTDRAGLERRVRHSSAWIEIAPRSRRAHAASSLLPAGFSRVPVGRSPGYGAGAGRALGRATGCRAHYAIAGSGVSSDKDARPAS